MVIYWLGHKKNSFNSKNALRNKYLYYQSLGYIVSKRLENIHIKGMLQSIKY